jgi:hypothetical protein
MGSSRAQFSAKNSSTRMTFMLRQRAALSIKAGSIVAEYGIV